MRIGELAARAGVSVRSLRYYEEQGLLLTSTRSASGQRHYEDVEIERVDLIQQLYAAGLSSRAIAELLPCIDTPGTGSSEVALARMAQERDRISEHITELSRTRDALDELLIRSRKHFEALRSAAVA